ncbi:ABC transporter substrate-binding protein, partial [Staphylococcus simulans]
VLSATLLTACNSNTTATNSEDKELTKEEKIVKDQTNREVKIKKDPDSIVVGGILPYFSTWFVGTNSTKEIKGIHPNAYNAAENSILSKISPDIKKASTEFVKNGDVNIEELSKINPDVYFENATEQKTLDKVAESGIPTMGLQTIKVEDADPLATFNSWLKVTSDIKGGKT